MSALNRPAATVTKSVERGGQEIEKEEKPLDGFEDLLTSDGFASVSCTMTKGVDFNSEKVSFHVSVRCDQNEETINRAGSRAFSKALEFVNEAADVLGWKKQ